MKFTPLHDRVLIKRLDKENKTKSGIIIPDTAKEKPAEGTVIAVGSGQLSDAGVLVPLTLKKDDKVIFAKWGGTEVKIDDEEYLVMKESDILGIIV
jgi:chaperonin GroES